MAGSAYLLPEQQRYECDCAILVGASRAASSTTLTKCSRFILELDGNKIAQYRATTPSVLPQFILLHRVKNLQVAFSTTRDLPGHGFVKLSLLRSIRPRQIVQISFARQLHPAASWARS
jgi:hypothetical protein